MSSYMHPELRRFTSTRGCVPTGVAPRVRGASLLPQSGQTRAVVSSSPIPTHWLARGQPILNYALVRGSVPMGRTAAQARWATPAVPMSSYMHPEIRRFTSTRGYVPNGVAPRVPGASLFGLQDETAALVEVDAARTGRAVAVVERHAPFEDIGIVRNVGRGGLGTRRVEEIAEFGQESWQLARSAAPDAFQRSTKASTRSRLAHG